MRVVCFCKSVTEEEIIDHVAIRQCCTTIEDIQNHTGANTGNQCRIMNPSGTCCHPDVQAVIAKALKMR